MFKDIKFVEFELLNYSQKMAVKEKIKNLNLVNKKGVKVNFLRIEGYICLVLCDADDNIIQDVVYPIGNEGKLYPRQTLERKFCFKYHNI